MRRRSQLATLSTRQFAALLAGAVGLALAVRLTAGPSPDVSLGFIGFIIAAISAVASWIGAAGAAVATATVAVVQWLTASLGWLTAHVASFLKSTGAMFAKVWDASKKLWFDVVRPAIQKIGKWISEARDWLKQKLTPVFHLLQKIRERIREVYDRFIKPVLDAIETTRGVLNILAKLHVPFAKQLDGYLAQAEQAITENFLRVLEKVNQAIDILNSVVTFDFLFQRWSFLRTVERDTKYIWQALMNGRGGTLTAADRAAIASRSVPPTTEQLRTDFERYLSTKDGPVAKVLAETKAYESLLQGRGRA